MDQRNILITLFILKTEGVPLSLILVILFGFLIRTHRSKTASEINMPIDNFSHNPKSKYKTQICTLNRSNFQCILISLILKNVYQKQGCSQSPDQVLVEDNTTQSRPKRRLCEGGEECEGMEVEGGGETLAHKRQRETDDVTTTSSSSSGTSTFSGWPNMNFPLPDEDGVPALIVN